MGQMRISVLIHEDLDPEVYTLLLSIEKPRTRSEFARRLMKEGARKEYKLHKAFQPPLTSQPATRSDAGQRAGVTPQKREKVTPLQRVGGNNDLQQASISQDDSSVDFSAQFAAGIQGVPKR